MYLCKLIAAILALLAGASVSWSQAQKESKDTATPPKLLLLKHRDIQPGRGSEWQKLRATTAQACDRFDVTPYWIELHSLSGPREELFFSPLDSFEELEHVANDWRTFYATHRDLAHVEQEMDGNVEAERTTLAVRREALGYNAESVDFAEMRYLHVVEVRLFPGRESEFTEALQLLAESSAKIKADTPWLVYQLNVGMSSPTFLILTPLNGLAKKDDLLAADEKLLESGETEPARRLEEIARESYASADSNLYEVRPELSHVPNEWASADPDFWRPGKEQAAKADSRPAAKP
jgi:hypothetical protein